VDARSTAGELYSNNTLSNCNLHVINVITKETFLFSTSSLDNHNNSTKSHQSFHMNHHPVVVVDSITQFLSTLYPMIGSPFCLTNIWYHLLYEIGVIVHLELAL
jgi:hypothetical protein